MPMDTICFLPPPPQTRVSRVALAFLDNPSVDLRLVVFWKVVRRSGQMWSHHPNPNPSFKQEGNVTGWSNPKRLIHPHTLSGQSPCSKSKGVQLLTFITSDIWRVFYNECIYSLLHHHYRIQDQHQHHLSHSRRGDLFSTPPRYSRRTMTKDTS